MLLKHKASEIPLDIIQTVHVSYRSHLKAGRIALFGEKILLFKILKMQRKALSLIIVPESIRKTLFNYYHGIPSSGHMGKYKTLYRLRLCFFWPGIRELIQDWVVACAHCVSYNTWHTRSSELHFSWPVTIPFWIMHINLWSPGTTETEGGDKIHLMNGMCNLTQFVISSITDNIEVAALAQFLCQT